MPRFIHTADWQIGKQFGQFEKQEAAFLTDQRIATVASIGDLATRLRVDAVLVAGDVFDLQAVSAKTLHRLAQAMTRFNGPWVLLPGNHDAALAESVWQQWQRAVSLPANIHLALTPGSIALEAAGLAVLCAPLTQRHSRQDLTAAFEHWQTDPALVRVGLAHGSVEGMLPETMETHNPIAADRPAQANLDYLALGDWHGTLIVNPRVAYSGAPETDVFRNNDSGNVLEVSIGAPGQTPAIVRHRLSHYHWQEHSCHLAVPEDLHTLREQFAHVDRQVVLKLHLTGTLDLLAHQQLRQWLEVIEAQVHALQLDDAALTLAPGEGDLADLCADGYLAEVIDELSQQQETDEICREALKLLLQKLAARQQRQHPQQEQPQHPQQEQPL